MQSKRDTPDHRIQIWSQNYDPEPQGIAPIVGTTARGLAGLGAEVTVVTAHPHYPEPSWGTRTKPYRERRDGIPVFRLPIWPGRGSGLERIRQDLSATVAGNLIAPLLPPADSVIAVSPSLPGLSAAMFYSAIRQVPWILWLQDIVTEGAVTTGELSEGHPALKAARAFEQKAYRSADRIIVISRAFRAQLLEQGVPEEKISLIYNPITHEPRKTPFAERKLSKHPRILAMGNVGRSQGLEAVVNAFQADADLAGMKAELLVTGSGVALDSVRQQARSERVRIPGLVDGETLNGLLSGSHLGLVSQKAGLREFNLPSRLMNYMSFGLPVIASVDPSSETARIVIESGAGWVTDSARPDEFASQAARVLADPAALERASAAGVDYAAKKFRPTSVARSINSLAMQVTSGD